MGLTSHQHVLSVIPLTVLVYKYKKYDKQQRRAFSLISSLNHCKISLNILNLKKLKWQCIKNVVSLILIVQLQNMEFLYI